MIDLAIGYLALCALALAVIVRSIVNAQTLPRQNLEGYSSEPLSGPPACDYRWVTYAEIRADIERMRKRRAAAGVRIDLDTDIIRN